jgi:hypothetical protein
MQQAGQQPGVDSATERLVSASRALVAIAARSLGRVEDQVTLPQYRALVVLSTRGALRPVDLAEALDVMPSTCACRKSRPRCVKQGHFGR